MRIYNLFPLLAGPFKDWRPHMERAAGMGFDWVFVNPIQKLGRSGSLYSIADYFAINKAFLNPRSRKSPADQVRAMVADAERLGMSAMIDLVINHCAIDSPLVRGHPEWFVREGGRVANPFCLEEDGNKVVWQDLAQFDHDHSPDRNGLLRYCGDVVEYLVGLGFRGFRCDAAYQIPTGFWRELIERTRSVHPDVLFGAETLGCSPEKTRETASAGFDFVFNSSKWWDFDGEWLLDQYEQTRHVAPSVSFPESHDTERLFSETGGNLDAMKQRYLFSALFSTGVMMPMGYEYGFRRRLDVVSSRPKDWEEPSVDLTGFIAQVNRLKDRYPVLRGEGRIEIGDHPNPAILVLQKQAVGGDGEALILLNKDARNRQHCHIDDLYRHVQAPPPLYDVSPDWPIDYLPTPFEFDLAPGMGRVMVTGRDGQ